MKRADKLNAAVIVIIGDDELARGVAQIRNMETGEQSEIALDEVTTSPIAVSDLSVSRAEQNVLPSLEPIIALAVWRCVNVFSLPTMVPKCGNAIV